LNVGTLEALKCWNMFKKVLERRLRKLITDNNMLFDLVQGKVQPMKHLSYNKCKKNTEIWCTGARTDKFPSELAYTKDQITNNPFLFIVVLDVISEEFRCGLPCEQLLADDLAIKTDTEEEMQSRYGLVGKLGRRARD